MMQRYYSMLIYGFAIFSMFFGSGNLVFPLQIGQMAGSYWFIGFLGLFITGVFLPFLGLFVIKLYGGNYKAFFAEAGPVASFILPMFTLSLLGSFGVIPRCITVAHGGLSNILPDLSLSVFSLIFCGMCFAFCLKDHIMMSVLGKWMSPLLLVSLLILLVLGTINAPIIQEDLTDSFSVFTDGFMVGYQTMDLFAAFFFSVVIFKQIQNTLIMEATAEEGRNTKNILKIAVKPSLIGAGLLAFVYLGFVFLGAHYKPITQNVSPELILSTITTSIIGHNASFLIAIIVIFSCMTTAVALNNIYARYLCDLLRYDSKKFPMMLLATTATSFGFSLLDFRGISAFLAPALEITYPSIIILTIFCIIAKDQYGVAKKIIFYALLLMMLFGRYWG